MTDERSGHTNLYRNECISYFFVNYTTNHHSTKSSIHLNVSFWRSAQELPLKPHMSACKLRYAGRETNLSSRADLFAS